MSGLRLLEALIYPFIIFLFDIYTKGMGFLNLNPNPYLLVVLIVALRMGTTFGVITSIASMFFSALSIYSSMGSMSFILHPKILMNFFILIASSILFGLIKDGYDHKVENITRRLKEREEEILMLKEELEKCRRNIKALGKRITMEKRGVSMLVSHLSSMDLVSSEDVFNEVVKFVRDFIGSDGVSIYSFSKNDFLRLKIRSGVGVLPNSFRIDDSVVVKNAMKNGVASILDMLKSDERGRIEVEPAVAARIDGKEGTMGFLVIELMNPEDINRSVLAYTKMVAGVISSLVETSMRIEEKLLERLKNPDGTYPMDLLEDFMKRLDERYEDFSLPYSVVKLRISPQDIEKLKKVVRSTDRIFHDPSDDSYVVVLQVCNSAGLDSFIKRVKKAIPEAEIIEKRSKE